MLGTKKTENGVKFRIFSENASLIELCLFSDDEKNETKISMKKNDEGIWSVNVDGIKEGQKYGYRAHGEYLPEMCLFFNPQKLLVDPYAKEISETMGHWDNEDMLVEADADTKNLVPKSVVRFDKDNSEYAYLNKKPNHSINDTIIYELNVKGFSATNPKVPKNIRGTFLGLCHPASIEHLKSLNITQIELMPIMPTCGGYHLKKEKGLSDYWGYNPYNHFAVDPKFGSLEDFKQMINEMHKNGIEVCMDVVYNHTAPNQIISYEGLDCLSYHRIIEDDGKKYLLNSTGCDNSFNVARKPALDVCYNSMKYFSSIGVDAFRLDLAGDLAMDENNQFSQDAPFLLMLEEIKKETGVKVYGEPWNADGIYEKGMMNKNIFEWNDKGKKAFRKLGQYNVIGKQAYEMAGKQTPDVNYVTTHDGFSLYDLVNYNKKDNYANNEDNRDGNNNEYPWTSNNKEIDIRRAKTMMAMAVLARGVPLINGGDEILKTQKGNNNAYCQDNNISWHDWANMNDEQKDMYIFSRKLLHLRKSVAAFSCAEAMTPNDVMWFNTEGKEMSQDNWDCGFARTLAYKLHSKNGGQDYIVVFSGNVDGNTKYKLPKAGNSKKWSVVFDTSDKKAQVTTSVDEYSISPFGLVVLTSSGDSVKENMQIMPYKKVCRER